MLPVRFEDGTITARTEDIVQTKSGELVYPAVRIVTADGRTHVLRSQALYDLMVDARPRPITEERSAITRTVTAFQTYALGGDLGADARSGVTASAAVSAGAFGVAAVAAWRRKRGSAAHD